MATTVPPMTHANLDDALRRLGWRVRNPDERVEALRDFQRAYALPGVPGLLIDGKNGPATRTAIRESLRRNKAGKPDASGFYSFRDFACSCGGRLKGCRKVRVLRGLLIALDALCKITGGLKLAVVSGYRCPARNAAVGGASKSEHVDGAAADLAYPCTVLVARRLRRFSGIGYKNGKVRHVDVRHLSGSNMTGGTPDRPTLWQYP